MLPSIKIFCIEINTTKEKTQKTSYKKKINNSPLRKIKHWVFNGNNNSKLKINTTKIQMFEEPDNDNINQLKLPILIKDEHYHRYNEIIFDDYDYRKEIKQPYLNFTNRYEYRNKLRNNDINLKVNGSTSILLPIKEKSIYVKEKYYMIPKIEIQPPHVEDSFPFLLNSK